MESNNRGGSFGLAVALTATLLLAFACSDATGSDGGNNGGGNNGGGFNNYIQPHDDAGDNNGLEDTGSNNGVDDTGGNNGAADVPLADAPDDDAFEDAPVAEDVPPGDPWANTDGLSNGALKTALRGLVDDQRVFTYNQSRDLMYGRAATIDVHDGMIECVYTGRMVRPDGSRTPGGFNTEHSWPRDEGADVEPMVSDLHHLFPTDDNANGARATYNFGETSCTSQCEYSNGGSMLGPNAEGGGLVFEVRPARRGDIARAHFYFAVRYDRAISTAEEAVLRRWHDEDPVDDLERGRNDAIERFQRNRNPFVDRPDFVDRIDNF